MTDEKNHIAHDHLPIRISIILLAGTVLFTFRFFTQGGDWVSFPSNRHLYTDGVLNRGRVLDTTGKVLAAYDGGWTYYDDSSVRKATLHAVGDPSGAIGTGALTQFASRLTATIRSPGRHSPVRRARSLSHHRRGCLRRGLSGSQRP